LAAEVPLVVLAAAVLAVVAAAADNYSFVKTTMGRNSKKLEFLPI
jgi:hypothetical protein